jgi:hypothetical protein
MFNFLSPIATLERHSRPRRWLFVPQIRALLELYFRYSQDVLK